MIQRRATTCPATVGDTRVRNGGLPEPAHELRSGVENELPSFYLPVRPGREFQPYPSEQVIRGEWCSARAGSMTRNGG